MPAEAFVHPPKGRVLCIQSRVLQTILVPTEWDTTLQPAVSETNGTNSTILDGKELDADVSEELQALCCWPCIRKRSLGSQELWMGSCLGCQ